MQLAIKPMESFSSYHLIDPWSCQGKFQNRKPEIKKKIITITFKFTCTLYYKYCTSSFKKQDHDLTCTCTSYMYSNKFVLYNKLNSFRHKYKQFDQHPAYPIKHSVIKPNRTQIVDWVRLSNIIELTIKFGQLNKIERSINEQLTIEQNWIIDYQTVDNRTLSMERLITELLFVYITDIWMVHRPPPLVLCDFTYQETDSKQNRVRLNSIVFDWVRLVRKSNSQQNRCSITKPNRTIGVRLGSIDF